ncbi:MAG: hypothetical protein JNK82_27575 [Myxococcaceae bacterium]|nr:hypothetical protein [Myxococcaceae bacterium]
MSDERETLKRERDEAVARVARLEQEAATNRAFFSRSLTQAHQDPRPGGGPTVWHALSLVIGVGIGVFVTLLLIVMRGEPTPLAPLPPERKVASLPVVRVRDAGVLVAAAQAPVPAPKGDAGGAPAVAAAQRPAERPDDRGTLNVTATAAAVVFIDGQRAGAAPLTGARLQPGAHVIRVECGGDGGEAAEHRLMVPAYADVDLEHDCES